IGGAATGTGSLFVDDIMFTGVNLTNGVATSGIAISAVTVAPLTITNSKNNVIVLNCNAIDSNGNITQVLVDLSQVGGPSSFPMTNIGAHWRCSYTVLSGV